MATRKKKTIITGVTREAADEAFATYAKADANINKINAEIELACAKIREKYAEKLATLTDEREQAFDTLQSFATEKWPNSWMAIRTPKMRTARRI